MYNAQTLVEKIRQTAKSKSILIKTMLESCDLNVNTLSQISDKKGLSSFSLAKIADYLDCSVDYLLGRTQEQNISSSYSNNNITNSNNIALGESSTIYNRTDEISAEIAKIVSNLDIREQTELLTLIYKFNDEHINKNNEKKYTRFVAARSKDGQSTMRNESVSKEAHEELINAPETDMDF